MQTKPTILSHRHQITQNAIKQTVQEAERYSGGQNGKYEKRKKGVPWARSPPTWLTAMTMPRTIARAPKTRSETARAISLIGGLLLTVYDVSIIISSSDIENAWSTYAIAFVYKFFWWVLSLPIFFFWDLERESNCCEKLKKKEEREIAGLRRRSCKIVTFNSQFVNSEERRNIKVGIPWTRRKGFVGCWSGEFVALLLKKIYFYFWEIIRK